MLDFLHTHLIDVIDIILVGLLIYEIYKLIRGTTAMSIFVGIFLLYMVWVLARSIHMELLSAIMGQVLGVGVVALIVIFQPEIRRFLLHLGSNSIGKRKIFIMRLLFGNTEQTISSKTLDELTQAVRKMSETNTGALIVMTHTLSLTQIVETGDKIDAIINRRLIENIFFKNSPLHDGALIMDTNKIIAARCTLPVSDNPTIAPQYGMRHKAAVGITEQSDATAIVVSEETGEISFVQDGNMRAINSIAELRLTIANSYRTPSGS